MIAPRKILVPTDFSEGVKIALSSAIEMLPPDGELVIVNVFQSPTLFGPETTLDSLVADLRANAARGLEAARREALELGAPRVTAKLVVGSPWHEIVELARREAVDLVVISTHGRTGIKHVLMGSVAEKVIRHADCPVLVVRQRPDATAASK